jgi:hypothetical protein
VVTKTIGDSDIPVVGLAQIVCPLLDAADTGGTVGIDG